MNKTLKEIRGTLDSLISARASKITELENLINDNRTKISELNKELDAAADKVDAKAYDETKHQITIIETEIEMLNNKLASISENPITTQSEAESIAAAVRKSFIDQDEIIRQFAVKLIEKLTELTASYQEDTREGERILEDLNKYADQSIKAERPSYAARDILNQLNQVATSNDPISVYFREVATDPTIYVNKFGIYRPGAHYEIK